MRLKGISFILVLLSAGPGILAQPGSIHGRITTGEPDYLPLQYVNIGIRSTAHGVATDEQGRFVLNELAYGDYTLIVSMVGYGTLEQRIELSEDNTTVSLQLVLKEKAGTLDEVVISGTMKEVSRLETPVPVEVYSSQFFKANPTPSVFESLQNINGVRPQINCNVCNTGDIHINGLEGPYTMVLIDGMPIVSGLSTVYGLTGIPQALIERLEVVKGPASTLYGSEAVGGLLNIITKSPQRAPLFSGDVFSTSWGEVNADMSAKFTIDDRVDNLMGLSYFNYQNPMDNNGDGFTDVTLQHRISLFNKVAIRRNQNRTFHLAGRYLYEDRWGGDMRWSPEFRGGDEIYGESIFTSRWEAMGAYQLPVDPKITFRFSANGHTQNSVYGAQPFNAQQYVGFAQMDWMHRVSDSHDLLMGLAYRYTFYDDDTPATESTSSVHLPGVFVQDEITLNSQNTLLLGGRYDYNSLHGSILSPRINYKWNSRSKQTILRLSAGNGFRVANVFTEDHAALTGAREVVFNGDLSPETSWNVNFNTIQKVYTRNGLYMAFDASVFYTYFTNRIIPDYESNPNQIIYGNLEGSAVSKGVSLNSEISWPSGLLLNGGITLMDVRVYEPEASFRQLLTERFSGVWGLKYTVRRWGIALDYTGNVYSPMRLPLLGPLDQRDEYSPWFSIQNLQVTKKFAQWEVYGGVKNLFNFTPPSNAIARPFDPFDREVVFDENGQAVPSPGNEQALTFDPTYVYAANQGIRGFLGFRFTLP